MRGPGGWWRGKSTPAKVEAYTRWSFHFFPLIEIATLAVPLLGVLPLPQAFAAWAVVTVHAVLCAVTASRAFDWMRGLRKQPLRLMYAVSALSGAIGVGAIALARYGPGGPDAAGAAGSVLTGVLAFGMGAITLVTLSRRRVMVTVAGFAAGSGTVALLLGTAWTIALGTALAVLLSTGFLAFTSAFSMWLLKSVYELDEARETRARLAVAEERLRFGRDLHDVMGRNLAVIALKSELAVQLARRQRPEALDQMIEVQRIAQETQMEVRAVVRGYREADLDVELAGARGVLNAAGIECRIHGSAAGLPADVQSALGWVVREATTNVLRHGNAAHCSVTVRVREGHVVLIVQNDGVPESATTGRGSGLDGLRERLAEVGGTLTAEPRPKGRFRVTAEVPLPEPVVPSQRPGTGRTGEDGVGEGGVGEEMGSMSGVTS